MESREAGFPDSTPFHPGYGLDHVDTPAQSAPGCRAERAAASGCGRPVGKENRDDYPCKKRSRFSLRERKGMWYLFGAFSAFWLIVFVYILSVSRKQSRLSHELETLRKTLEDRDT